VVYSPLAGGAVFDDPVTADVAAKHDTTPAAATIAWLRSYDNVVTIAKASSRAHLGANWAAQTVELDDEDVAQFEGIDREMELYPE
jgi:2,5-diketo-D-gluconate reductase B